MTRLLLASALLTGALSACALSAHPVTPADAPAAGPSVDLSAPGPLVLDSVVSATWSVPLSGLVNLDHPAAADLENADTPIVLPVHVLTHPERGVFVVDTGAPASLDPLTAAMGAYLSDMEIVDPIGDIVARHGGALSGALITHAHLDHVLGLLDLDVDVPVFMGPSELHGHAASNAMLRRSFGRILDGRPPVLELVFDDDATIGGMPALDLLGDGSLFALHVPGHTEGSVAYLARTTEGPALFTGDTAHLIWSWERGVESGSYSADQELHAESLTALRELAASLPNLRVFTGHELDGVGTGVDDI